MFFRIDSFSVPEEARDEFNARSADTMALLRKQAGFVRGEWFEKVGGPGTMNIVTMVTWADQESVEAAGRAVRALHEESGFDPAAFAREHGITESKALYVAQDGAIAAKVL